ncbi:MAG: hypothetical protein QM741_02550 [Rudaea sp.]
MIALRNAARESTRDGRRIFAHHADDAQAGAVGDLRALAVRGRNRRATRQRHAERLGETIHRQRGAHRVAVADARRRRSHFGHELLEIDFAGAQAIARFPDDRARAHAPLALPAVEHRSAAQHDRRQVEHRDRHQLRRSRLVAAGGEDDAVERIALQDLGQRQRAQVAVERGGRPAARLLDRMDGKFERDAAGRADAVAHARGELQVMAVARRQIATRLRDADDRTAGLEFFARQPVVQIALDVQSRVDGMGRIAEPVGAAQRFRLLAHRVGLVCSNVHPRAAADRATTHDLPWRQYKSRQGALLRRRNVPRPVRRHRPGRLSLYPKPAN